MTDVREDDPLIPADSEICLWSGHPSLWSFSGWLFVSAILVFAYGFGFLLAAGVLLYRRSRIFTVTNRCISAETGFLFKKKECLPVSEAERVETVYPSFSLVPGIGDLVVYARNGKTIRMDAVPCCGEVRSVMEGLARKAVPPDPGDPFHRSPE